MTTENFTKGFVDAVIRMRADKNEAKRFLKKLLISDRNQISEEHFKEMVEYINAQ